MMQSHAISDGVAQQQQMFDNELVVGGQVLKL